MNRIYISGKISGTDLETTKLKFRAAENEIEAKYNTVFIAGEHSNTVVFLDLKTFKIINPTELGLTFKDSWLKCMTICIWHLLKCRSIYMLKDWRDSRGAKIEFWIAVVLNYKIIFQEND